MDIVLLLIGVLMYMHACQRDRIDDLTDKLNGTREVVDAHLDENFALIKALQQSGKRHD